MNFYPESAARKPSTSSECKSSIPELVPLPVDPLFDWLAHDKHVANDSVVCDGKKSASAACPNGPKDNDVLTAFKGLALGLNRKKSIPIYELYSRSPEELMQDWIPPQQPGMPPHPALAQYPAMPRHPRMPPQSAMELVHGVQLSSTEYHGDLGSCYTQNWVDSNARYAVNVEQAENYQWQFARAFLLRCQGQSNAIISRRVERKAANMNFGEAARYAWLLKASERTMRQSLPANNPSTKDCMSMERLIEQAYEHAIGIREAIIINVELPSHHGVVYDNWNRNVIQRESANYNREKRSKQYNHTNHMINMSPKKGGAANEVRLSPTSVSSGIGSAGKVQQNEANDSDYIQTKLTFGTGSSGDMMSPRFTIGSSSGKSPRITVGAGSKGNIMSPRFTAAASDIRVQPSEANSSSDMMSPRFTAGGSCGKSPRITVGASSGPNDTNNVDSKKDMSGLKKRAEIGDAKRYVPPARRHADNDKENTPSNLLNSPRLNSPRLNSPRLNSPRLNSPRLTSPRFNNTPDNWKQQNSPRENSNTSNDPIKRTIHHHLNMRPSSRSSKMAAAGRRPPNRSQGLMPNSLNNARNAQPFKPRALNRDGNHNSDHRNPRRNFENGPVCKDIERRPKKNGSGSSDPTSVRKAFQEIYQ